MASLSQGLGEGSPSTLPSYEDLHQPRKEQYVLPTENFRRLFWSLNGPLEASVFVMNGTRYVSAADIEPYHRQTAFSDTEASEWHSISQSPVSEPRISSVTVRVRELFKWEWEWLTRHRDHSEADGYNPAKQLWGPLTDRSPFGEEEENAPQYLLKCCGETRPPRAKYELLVRARGDFLTIHDFIMQVHPWLMVFRREALGALGTMLDNPLPVAAELMILPSLNELTIMQKDQWILVKKLPPVLNSSQQAGSAHTPQADEARARRWQHNSMIEVARRWRESQARQE